MKKLLMMTLIVFVFTSCNKTKTREITYEGIKITETYKQFWDLYDEDLIIETKCESVVWDCGRGTLEYVRITQNKDTTMFDYEDMLSILRNMEIAKETKHQMKEKGLEIPIIQTVFNYSDSTSINIDFYPYKDSVNLNHVLIPIDKMESMIHSFEIEYERHKK